MNRLIATTFAIVLGLTSALPAQVQRFSQNPSLQEQANAVQMSIVIDAPTKKVWKLIGEDFDKSKLFNVAAASTNYVKGNSAKVGSQRRTVGTDGKFIDVEIFRYSKSRRIVSWEIVDTDFAPITFGYSEYQLEALSDTQTRLTQISGFKMKSGFMDAAMRFQFPKILKSELTAIKYFLETGQAVTAGTSRKIRNTFAKDISSKRNW